MFCSPQGEGARAGEMSLFIRFAGCNLRCKREPGTRSPGGFDCDTEFMSGVRMSPAKIVEAAQQLWDLKASSSDHWVVFTGGEPMLQLDRELCDHLHEVGWLLAIETNGTREINPNFKLDWITVSPKVAEHAIRQLTATEVKYVRGFGQALPRTRVKADYHYISPAFDGTDLDPMTLEWCRNLIEPPWQLSVQMHKAWKVR